MFIVGIGMVGERCQVLCKNCPIMVNEDFVISYENNQKIVRFIKNPNYSLVVEFCVNSGEICQNQNYAVSSFSDLCKEE